MRSLFFILSFILFSTAFACVQKDALFGEVYFGGKKPEEIFKRVDKKWNVNSDEFDFLYLKSSTKPSDIKLIVNGKVIEKKLDSKKSKKKGFYQITGLSFQKDISDGPFKFPFTLKVEFKDSGLKVCSQLIHFQVVK